MGMEIPIFEKILSLFTKAISSNIIHLYFKEISTTGFLHIFEWKTVYSWCGFLFNRKTDLPQSMECLDFVFHWKDNAGKYINAFGSEFQDYLRKEGMK